MKNAAVNATTAIADGVSSLLGGSKVKKLEAETGHSQSSRPNAERRSRKNW